MRTPGKTCWTVFTLIVLLSACTPQLVPGLPEADVSTCHIIYDAGSKRTRLYVYEQTATGWLRHSGPKTVALADPARAIRGKTMSDADTVVAEIVTAVENIRHDGPADKKGEPEWLAFDWRERCNVDAVSVYATAGMRMAKQQDAVATEKLWELLNDKLSVAVGMPVTTRTVSGYEEGLFAWLAVRERQVDGDFGVTEMGGASLQVTFPCPSCKASRQVKVKGRSLAVYSYSFFGWGQDEAWEKFGSSPACTRGAGVDNPDWKEADCAVEMASLSDTFAYLGAKVRNADGLRWYLSGAFRYRQDTDIDQFCRQGMDSGYEQESSCFRAVYLQNVLDILGMPGDSEPTEADWTLGAVVCTATRCLETQ